jgi:hypothetical protein
LRRGIICGGSVSWALIGFMVRHSGVSMQVSKSSGMRQEEDREKSSDVVHDEKSLKSVQSSLYDNQRSSHEGERSGSGPSVDAGGVGRPKDTRHLHSAREHSASAVGGTIAAGALATWHGASSQPLLALTHLKHGIADGAVRCGALSRLQVPLKR